MNASRASKNYLITINLFVELVLAILFSLAYSSPAMKNLTPLQIARNEAYLNQLVSYKGQTISRAGLLVMKVNQGWKLGTSEETTYRQKFDRANYKREGVEKTIVFDTLESPCGEYIQRINKIEKWYVDTFLFQALEAPAMV